MSKNDTDTPEQDIQNIFRQLNVENVSYCHWKSNSHLNDSFSGETDFDLLVAQKDADEFRRVLTKYGMKRRWSTADKAYSFMEDYIGFHEPSGAMYHFHIHYKIITGQRYDKNYVLPFSDQVLSSTIDNANYTIKTSNPEWELALLLIRIALKTQPTLRNFVKVLAGKNIAPSNIDEEYEYLLEKADLAKSKSYLDDFFGASSLISQLPDIVNLTGRIEKSSLRGLADFFSFILLRRQVLSKLANHRCRTGTEHRREKRARGIYKTISVRSGSKGGIRVAFIGADGAGKSSTIEIISKWLSWKYSVSSLYMGIPKNHSGVIALRRLAGFTRKLGMGKFGQFIMELQWVYIAYLRYRLHVRSIQASNTGKIVIFDRHPHAAFSEMKEPMDGSRVAKESPLKSLEERLYSRIDPPDAFFVLNVDLETSVARKPEHGTEATKKMIQTKISAIDVLCRSENNAVVIDSCRHRDLVLRDIKKALWGFL